MHSCSGVYEGYNRYINGVPILVDDMSMNGRQRHGGSEYDKKR